jgi:hypothetical protein
MKDHVGKLRPERNMRPESCDRNYEDALVPQKCIEQRPSLGLSRIRDSLDG